MKRAYQELAQENLKISEDFKYVDTENHILSHLCCHQEGEWS